MRNDIDKCHTFALIVEEAYGMFGPLTPEELAYMDAHPEVFNEEEVKAKC